MGKRARCVALGKNLIVQAAAHHSYCDLRIVVLCEQEETAQWEFCRWLPHCWDEGHTARLIANTPETIRALLERLERSSRRGPLPGRAPGSAQRRVQAVVPVRVRSAGDGHAARVYEISDGKPPGAWHQRAVPV